MEIFKTTTLTLGDPGGGAPSRTYSFTLNTQEGGRVACVTVDFPGASPIMTYQLRNNDVVELVGSLNNRVKATGKLTYQVCPFGRNGRYLVCILRFTGNLINNSVMFTGTGLKPGPVSEDSIIIGYRAYQKY